jgi:hypothetical protein
VQHIKPVILASLTANAVFQQGQPPTIFGEEQESLPLCQQVFGAEPAYSSAPLTSGNAKL